MMQRIKTAYRKAQLLLLAVSFLVAVAGHIYLRGTISGYEIAQDECYGMSCEQYMVIVGQAAKEAKREQKVASIWSVVE